MERKGFPRRILKGIWIILALLVFGIGILLARSAKWAIGFFGGVSIDEIIFHLKVPLDGTDVNTIIDFIHICLIPALLAMLILGMAIVLPRLERRFIKRLSARTGKSLSVTFRIGKRSRTRRQASMMYVMPVWLIWIIALLGLSWGIACVMERYPVVDYLKAQRQNSKLIEEEYVEPDQSLLSFPEEKRNLIYIYLESMESSFVSVEDGGAFETDYIPELTRLAKENIHFSSGTGKLGGAVWSASTGWTIAGMFAQTTGLPLKLPVDGNSMNEYSTFFPGVISLGELLREQGYKNYLMIGSDAAFGGRQSYFSQHGDYEIYDYYWAAEQKKIPEGYSVFWGFEDQRLIEMAKEKLLEIASEGEPFNFTILTVDTHFPDGYRCELCKEEHDTPYKDALSCSSRQIAELIEWIQKQDFYENTTIVMSGDHLTMSADLSAEMPAEYERHVYNAIIHSAAEAQRTEERIFTTMDMFPTTLAAMGVTIEGERLGLGTNLFSGKMTLPEEYGIDYFNDELGKKSEFYNWKLLYGE